ncbi:hypothetical protein FSP39_014165 [Pinctada imbricata]|uniref:Uncharacterized protein n=1 Tax=Pinctada imbricata TaxID=66713 RepID=A0AA88YAD8_PINIB|nr:hypothetical protein FSP39_014165 [Pinctada imbricata]
MAANAISVSLTKIQSYHIHIAVLSYNAFQQCLMSLPSSVKATFLVAEVMCARDEDWFKAQLLSISLLMSGVCTLLQNTIGVRLPVYQGPISSYIIPLLNLLDVPEFACPSRLYDSGNVSSSTYVIRPMTALMALFLSLYLDGRMMPIPVWSKEKGFIS